MRISSRSGPTVCKAGGKYLVWGSDGLPAFSEALAGRIIVMPGTADLNRILYDYRRHLAQFPEMSETIEFVKIQFDRDGNVSERPKGETR